MEIQAILKEILPKRSGTSASGRTWEQQSIVVETEGQYPKHACLDCKGKVMEYLANLQVGTKYQFHFDIDAREWQGKYFNTITCWKIDNV